MQFRLSTKLFRTSTILFCVATTLFACTSSQQRVERESFNIEFEKYTLANGLDVILHQDHSDPVVAVALTFHVGSARERLGRTGFAHLFEHLLFLESENLGKGGLDKLSSRVGGSGANGSTNRDRTNYFQTVPKDALEKMLWAEADKLGFFINTVTEPVLTKEKEVVKNEKRQGVDNQPYGHNNAIITSALYPETHPYHWQVIGSLEDLQNATLDDVKTFYRRWYVPNNATLTIAGDFDSMEVKTWVEKYFGEIPRGEEIVPLPKQKTGLTATKKFVFEDNFANLPQLTLAWPTVEEFHPDSYALAMLADLLTDGKKAPLNKIIVDERQLAPNVSAFNSTSELAGEFILLVRSYPNTHLDSVRAAIDEGLQLFIDSGVQEEDLQRIKAKYETDFYAGLNSVLGKGFQLAQYNIFAGDPGFIQQDLQNYLAVTPADIERVYRQYLQGKAHIANSMVPIGEMSLALSDSQAAQIEEERIIAGAEGSFTLSEESNYPRTPSRIDRAVEPPYGPTPTLSIPTVWQQTMDNGLHVYAIENNEIPMVNFTLNIDGGHRADTIQQAGAANLLADLLTKGTATKTTAELEAAIDNLGADIDISATDDEIVISGSCLARHYPALMTIVAEMLLQPRWDEQEFAILKQQTLSQLEALKANPNALAYQLFDQLLYGNDHILGISTLGTADSVEAMSIADLKQYYQNHFSAKVSRFHLVGDVTRAQALNALTPLAGEWLEGGLIAKEMPAPQPVEPGKIYFYDVPGAKQSVFLFGYLAMPETDTNYYPATVANYILGGGGFASRLTQELREGKGYTYRIGSGFSGDKMPGPFAIQSGVRSNVTKDATALIIDILKKYPDTFSENDLATTKSFLSKSNARAFETSNAKLSMLNKLSAYGWQADYIKQREAIVADMTVDKIQTLAKTHFNPEKMIFLIVGDAQTQLAGLEELGFGEPVLLPSLD